MKTTSLMGASWACGLRPLPLSALPQASAPVCLLHARSEYAPFIDAFVKQIHPGFDEFVAEKYASDLEVPLKLWRDSICSATRDLRCIHESLADDLEGTLLGSTLVEPLRAKPPVQSEGVTFLSAKRLNRTAFMDSLRAYFTAFKIVELAELVIDAIEISGKEPVRLTTNIHYDFVGRLDRERREERTGEWAVAWQKGPGDRWVVLSWTAGSEMRSRLTGPGFVDIGFSALGANSSYREQMSLGIDHWRAVLDGASGIDVYGNNGICVGDYDGDGRDDIYVCQPAGLPNRLYHNRGDGMFVDVTEKAGVGILDGTSCALLADLNNTGRQDLIVVRTSGPLLFVNRGDGTFELKPDAFRFARPLQGTFTGASIADYDRDGFLDVYFCTYSFYQGLSEYEYPKPYYDAQNGPPNFLLKNRGNYEFEDVTVPSGLDVSNNRFSFGACWSDYNRDGWPDLYVVNDFGRKVLYRNNGNRSFSDVSAEAGVEDAGEGMSMTWLDYDNDGYDDMYVVNMWEAAGRRVTLQPEFIPAVPENVRRVYWQDAMGNTLLHNEGQNGRFRDASEGSGTRVGGWNWGSDAWDFDHDGYADLYIANGFISGRKKEDLSSFYWRQIAAHSLDSGGSSKLYADAWSAINEFIRSGYTWSGYQRNNFYLNNRNSTFTESAGIFGIDCLEDGRSFSLSDLDGDGRLELVLKNRTAPQVRIFHNELTPLGQAIVFSLKGTKSNRDAIGTVVEIQTASGRQRKTVRAGSGFLAQNTKTVHFGLGDDSDDVRATIEWPSGLKQVFDNVPPGHRIEIYEGSPEFRRIPFNPLREYSPQPSPPPEETVESYATWLLEPIVPPRLMLADAMGTKRSLADEKGHLQFLVFWGAACDRGREYLLSIEHDHEALKKSGITVMAVQMPSQEAAKQALPPLSFPVLVADEKTDNIYNVFYRYLFDRRRAMISPTSFLLDEEGRVTRVYTGPADVAKVVEDAKRIPRNNDERLKRALPFPGYYYRGQQHHNYFTYGVAFLQYEYLDEALTAFLQSIEHNTSNPAAYYNVGLIYLEKGMFDEARTNLEKAVELDPANADAWNNLGVVHGQNGDYTQAQSDFQHALDLQPAHLLAVQNMVKLLRFQEKPDEARKLLMKAIAADASQAELHKGLAMLYVEQQDLARARTEFEEAVRLEPNNVEMLNGLGVVLMQMGDSAQAMEFFERCRRMAPTYDRPYLNMAVIYLSEGKVDKAHDLLSEFLARQPDNKDIQEALKEVDSKR